MIPKEIMVLAALVFSWALVLMPAMAMLGNWSVFNWTVLICLITAPVMVYSFAWAQVERRRDFAGRRAYFRTQGY